MERTATRNRKRNSGEWVLIAMTTIGVVSIGPIIQSIVNRVNHDQNMITEIQDSNLSIEDKSPILFPNKNFDSTGDTLGGN